MTTLLILMKRRQDVSFDRFIAMLRDEYVPLWFQAKPVLKFVRLRVTYQPDDACAAAQSATQKCGGGPFDAVMMVEWPDRAAYVGWMGTPDALKFSDESSALKRRFLDLSRCSAMVTEDLVDSADQSKAELGRVIS